MAGGMHGRGACMAGGMHGGGHVWQGGMHGRGGMCATHTPLTRYYGYGIRSMSGRYASYWNAFLFVIILYFLSFEEKKKYLDILTFLCHFMKVIIYSLIRAFKQVKSQEMNSYCLVKLDEKL